MKKCIALLLAALLLLGLASCGKTKLNTGGVSNVVLTDNVSMSIKDGTLSNTSVVVILTNNTDREMIYGEGFYLELLENGEWKRLEPAPNFGWNLIAFKLEAKMSEKSTAEQEINWEMGYGKLPAGEYRLIKDVFAYEAVPINGSDIEYISAEFRIQ